MLFLHVSFLSDHSFGLFFSALTKRRADKASEKELNKGCGESISMTTNSEKKNREAITCFVTKLLMESIIK